jgi:rhamnogalacturonyl hydrolase YesR
MTNRIAAAILLIVLAAGSAQSQSEPRDIAEQVADRLITETEFGFVQRLPDGNQEGFYILDFGELEPGMRGRYRARTQLEVSQEVSNEELKRLGLGIGHTAGSLEVAVDEQVVYSGSGEKSRLRHLDYSLVRPPVRERLHVSPGEYNVSISFDPEGPGGGRVWLGLINLDSELAFEGVEFVLPHDMDAGDASRFLIQDSGGGWLVPAVHLTSHLPHRLAYSDWRYFTGTFLDALYNVSDVFDELDYTGFVERHMDYFLQHRDAIADERGRRGLIESPFGHYFRFSLLDDMGMQTVPFGERLRRKPDGESRSDDRAVVDRSLDHILNVAKRLPNGTWARLNPDSMTVWADDLFMGSVLLSRMAVIDDRPSYFDEAVKQVLRMHDLLYDPPSGLYWHGYFARSGEHSSSKWGRANGWTMMAKTELLSVLPKSHPMRDAVLEAFVSHARGLLAVQSDDGRWHQVLDNPDTYLETSCTAMFTRAFAEGVRRGWLPAEGFREAAERGWEAITRQVRDDGMVEGIVRGTPIFYSDQEYQDHPTRLNDPRGLGAVLYAASSMHTLLNE